MVDFNSILLHVLFQVFYIKSEFSWKSTIFECFTKGVLRGWALFYNDKFTTQDYFWKFYYYIMFSSQLYL